MPESNFNSEDSNKLVYVRSQEILDILSVVEDNFITLINNPHSKLREFIRKIESETGCILDKHIHIKPNQTTVQMGTIFSINADLVFITKETSIFSGPRNELAYGRIYTRTSNLPYNITLASAATTMLSIKFEHLKNLKTDLYLLDDILAEKFKHIFLQLKSDLQNWNYDAIINEN